MAAYCVASALESRSRLLNSIHKKGCTVCMGPANHCPIAMDGPMIRLYILYTIILHACTVGLRSRPRQTASAALHRLGPGLSGLKSTIHHFCALWCLVDHALKVRRPLYVCLVDLYYLYKAYNTVQHDLLCSLLRCIGFSPSMLAAIPVCQRRTVHEYRPASCPAHGGASGLPPQPHAPWHLLSWLA